MLIKTSKNLTSNFIKLILRKLGYQLQRTPKLEMLDYRERGNHPFSLFYHSHVTPILINADVTKGRGLRVLPLESKYHPFIHALKDYQNKADNLSSISNALELYYTKVQPKSAAEWLALDASTSTSLHAQKPWAVSMPWDNESPDHWRDAREQFVISENKSAGHHLTISDGWHFWGPVTQEKLAIEVQRLNALANSVFTEGLIRHDGHDGDIRAVVLKRNHDWCWQVAGGEHRAAVLCALGYKTIPIRVLQVVNREDVAIWPGVLAGHFSPSAALAVFDSIFEGRLPPIIEPWVTANSG